MAMADPVRPMTPLTPPHPGSAPSDKAPGAEVMDICVDAWTGISGHNSSAPNGGERRVRTSQDDESGRLVVFVGEPFSSTNRGH